MDNRRSDQLRTVASEFCNVHKEWAADGNRSVPDGAYWGAVDQLTEAFASGDVPEDCRALAEAVEAFAIEAQEFDEREDPNNNLNPPNDFWAAREKIEAALQGKSGAAALIPLESIPALKQLPGITDTQIAKIYGFKDRNGNLLPHLVQREIDTPGSVLKTEGAVDGRNWRDPRLPPLDGNEPAKRTATKISDRRKASAKAKSSQACPESPRELWALKPAIPVAQAAKMLQMPESEVAAMFAGFDDERERAEASGDQASAQTQRVRELAQQGKKPPAIANELELDSATVAKALEGWKPVKAGAK